MTESGKRELYKNLLKRERVFIVFLAAGETDVSLLPEPFTKEERLLMELCKEKAAKLKQQIPTDSKHPEGTGNGESNQEDEPKPEEPKKEPAKRTTRKVTAKK